ncbi:MAG: cytochrome c oxidase subunit 3, partial [Bdellovibrionales bacterium]|nr:cytochrome c oxidase subunit 3 [Bdellovibrionales bacterium]
NAALFFSLYFTMTGVHGIHVLIGMACIAWIYWRMSRGEFNSHRFAAVEFVGLYWHIVDLIWIFLFPLLYLIT